MSAERGFEGYTNAERIGAILGGAGTGVLVFAVHEDNAVARSDSLQKIDGWQTDIAHNQQLAAATEDQPAGAQESITAFLTQQNTGLKTAIQQEQDRSPGISDDQFMGEFFGGLALGAVVAATVTNRVRRFRFNHTQIS